MTTTTDTKQRIMDLLASRPFKRMAKAAIQKELGISKDAIHDAIAELKQEKLLTTYKNGLNVFCVAG